MWILEIENAKSDVRTYNFNSYSELDSFFQKYLSNRDLKEYETEKMFSFNEDSAKEQGELYYFDDGAFHGNYVIREN